MPGTCRHPGGWRYVRGGWHLGRKANKSMKNIRMLLLKQEYAIKSEVRDDWSVDEKGGCRFQNVHNIPEPHHPRLPANTESKTQASQSRMTSPRRIIKQNSKFEVSKTKNQTHQSKSGETVQKCPQHPGASGLRLLASVCEYFTDLKLDLFENLTNPPQDRYQIQNSKIDAFKRKPNFYLFNTKDCCCFQPEFILNGGGGGDLPKSSLPSMQFSTSWKTRSTFPMLNKMFGCKLMWIQKCKFHSNSFGKKKSMQLFTGFLVQ